MRYLTSLTLLIFFFSSSMAQQMPDNDYSPPPFKGKYSYGSGSLIMIDEAHNNFHTADNRYTPFASVLKSDGYKVKRGRENFTKNSLDGVKILVVANALNETNIKQWTLPTPSAFSEDEIKFITEWVKNGGSLFLISDHMPFAGASSELAKAFGFNFLNGFAINPVTYKKGKPDIFKKEDGTFQTKGLKGLDNVDSIATFMGQGFTIPDNAVSVINLDERFNILLPESAWKFDKNTNRVTGKGKSQGAYIKFGNGKVVVFGEAAMFSAQKAGNNKAGMNTAEGAQNYLLLLSLIHWLDTRE